MHKLMISLYDPQQVHMWHNVWNHVNPSGWDQMHEWLSDNHACKVESAHKTSTFWLKFETQEDLMAFVLQWS